MKKVLFLICALMMGVSAWAQATCAGCTIRIEPAADVHNGASAGDAAGFIDANGRLDISGMADGSLLYFDVVLEDLDFNLAGYQFEINFPARLTAFSTTTSDWNTPTGAVVTPGAFIANGGFPLQQLAAETDTTLKAATAQQNASGKLPVGFLLRDPQNRPLGSVATPNAGGAVARFCLLLNPNSQANCDSARETAFINLSATFVDASDDMFVNDASQRVQIGTGSVEIVFGSNLPATPGTAVTGTPWVRGDANRDGLRGAGDALRAALCALNGQATCTGWEAEPLAEYTQVFDYNCDGTAGAGDALSLALLALGQQNRSIYKTAQRMVLPESGAMVLDYENQRGAMAYTAFAVDSMRVGEPAITAEAQKLGWRVLSKRVNGVLEVMLINLQNDRDQVIPTVSFAFEPVADSASLTLLETLNQRLDLQEFAYSPLITTEGLQTVRPERDREIRRK